MRDRVSTKILGNGATRYGVYDETGALLRYEYIKLEDEPSTEGDFFNKANMLPDSITAMLGLKMENPQVKDALNVLANVGNLHVWERVQTYAEEVPAGYTLGELQENVLVFTENNTNKLSELYYADSISVDEYGIVSLVSPSKYAFYANANYSPGSHAKGKFFYIIPNTGSTAIDGIWFLPSDSNLNRNNNQYFAPTIQKVTGYASIPAGTTTDYLTSTDRNAYTDGTVDNTTITYLGQLGEPSAKMKLFSYVGTNTYGSNNPCSVTADFEIKILICIGRKDTTGKIDSSNHSGYDTWSMIADTLTESWQIGTGLYIGYSSNDSKKGYGKRSPDGKTFYWYCDDGSFRQLNEPLCTYYMLAIG